jgi:hypothetical protein
VQQLAKFSAEKPLSDPHLDRRMAVRYEVNSNVSCPFVLPIVQDLGEAHIKDVSTDGVGFWMSQKLEPGTLVAIGLSNPALNFLRTMVIQIVHATKHQGGGYIIGGIFLTPLTYEELRSLLM